MADKAKPEGEARKHAPGTSPEQQNPGPESKRHIKGPEHDGQQQMGDAAGEKGKAGEPGQKH